MNAGWTSGKFSPLKVEVNISLTHSGWDTPPVKVDRTTLMVYDRLLLHKPVVESGAIYLDNVVVNFLFLRAILLLFFLGTHSFLDIFFLPRNSGKYDHVSYSILKLMVGWFTLPETCSSPLKIGFSKTKVAFQPSISRCYVSFREGMCLFKGLYYSSELAPFWKYLMNWSSWWTKTWRSPPRDLAKTRRKIMEQTHRI